MSAGASEAYGQAEASAGTAFRRTAAEDCHRARPSGETFRPSGGRANGESGRQQYGGSPGAPMPGQQGVWADHSSGDPRSPGGGKGEKADLHNRWQGHIGQAAAASRTRNV